MKLLNSKKGQAFFTLAKALIFLVVITVAIIVFYVLFTGGAKGVSDLFGGIGTYEGTTVEVGGTQSLDESCASNWACEENLACIDNKCTASTTFLLYVSGQSPKKTQIIDNKEISGHCYEGFALGQNSFTKYNPEGEGPACKVFTAGKYLLEISSEKSGHITYKKDPKKTKQLVYLYTFPGEDLSTEYEFETDGYKQFYMNLNKQYSIEKDQEFRLCGWYKDTDCSDNSKFVAIRVDKIEQTEEGEAEEAGQGAEEGAAEGAGTG